MQQGRLLGVIPARLESQRLPRKPLHRLAGRTLIEWVWRRVSSLHVFDTCVVATDAAEIAAECARFGAPVELTSPHHPSGTDRIAEIAARDPYAGHDVVVNVQGDEPFVTAEQVRGAVAQVLAGHDIGTVAAPVRTLAAWRDPAVVKVVRRDDGAALYFTRSPVPHRREGDPTEVELTGERYLRHIGVYAYAPAALRQWVALPPHPLELLERLEQLRPLAAGLRIGVGVVDGAELGVDTIEDARRAERRLLEDPDYSTGTA